MKLGVYLPNNGPGTDPELLLRWARTVEGLGYDLLLTSDHVAVTDDVAAQYPAPFYEPFTLLSWLAAATTRITLGTTVLIIPYRHPLVTARMVGNLDQLSGGRFVFGVGSGWAEQEFEALGISHSQRGAITDDYLAAIRTHLANDIAAHDGKFASFSGVHTAPRSTPPIWVGGNSPAALSRTIDFGDAWHPLDRPVDWLRETLPQLAELAADKGRPTPGLAPRIKVRGNVPHTLETLRALKDLGAEAVILDTYDDDDPQQTPNPNQAWRDLAEIINTARNHDVVRQ